MAGVIAHAHRHSCMRKHQLVPKKSLSIEFTPHPRRITKHETAPCRNLTPCALDDRRIVNGHSNRYLVRSLALAGIIASYGNLLSAYRNLLVGQTPDVLIGLTITHWRIRLPYLAGGALLPQRTLDSPNPPMVPRFEELPLVQRWEACALIRKAGCLCACVSGVQ